MVETQTGKETPAWPWLPLSSGSSQPLCSRFSSVPKALRLPGTADYHLSGPHLLFFPESGSGFSVNPAAQLCWSGAEKMQTPLAPQATCPSAQSSPCVWVPSRRQEAKTPGLFPTSKYEGLCFIPWHLIDSFPHLRIFLFEMRPSTYTNITYSFPFRFNALGSDEAPRRPCALSHSSSEGTQVLTPN